MMTNDHDERASAVANDERRADALLETMVDEVWEAVFAASAEELADLDARLDAAEERLRTLRGAGDGAADPPATLVVAVAAKDLTTRAMAQREIAFARFPADTGFIELYQAGNSVHVLGPSEGAWMIIGDRRFVLGPADDAGRQAAPNLSLSDALAFRLSFDEAPESIIIAWEPAL